MVLLIAYVLLALGVSFLCSIMEAVLLSISPSFAAQAVQDGSEFGVRLKALKDEVDRPLAAILSLNTIAHTVGAAGAGAQAAIVFGSGYLGVASGVLTFLILVLSEIIPKTLGALYWRPLTAPVVRLLRVTMLLMWPLVKMAEWITRLIARRKSTVTTRRDEFAALADIGAEEGELHADETRILRSLLRFGALTARDIMTPRTVISFWNAGDTVADVLSTPTTPRFSRMPIVEGDVDHVTGFALRTEVLEAAHAGRGDDPVEKLARTLTVVTESLPLRSLFDRLVAERAHMVLVVDEYGGTAGLVTLEDVIETLLGLEIMDEADTVRDMRVLARTHWEARARSLGMIRADSAAHNP